MRRHQHIVNQLGELPVFDDLLHALKRLQLVIHVKSQLLIHILQVRLQNLGILQAFALSQPHLPHFVLR